MELNLEDESARDICPDDKSKLEIAKD